MKLYFEWLRNALVLSSGVVALAGCAEQQCACNEPMKIIFDTDMGNDIDDALALDMLYKYADEGRVELLGVTSNKEEPQSVEYLDILNTFYGYGSMPLGRITEGADCDRVNSFSQQTAADPSYSRSVSSYAELPESVDLLRRLLAEQPDGQTTIVAVGFSTNLQRLLLSQADAVSPLDGVELVRTKVKRLVMMAGDFVPEDDAFPEYNIRIDQAAAKTVFEQWPTPIVTSPWEVGNAMLYPCESILSDFGYVEKHPMAEAYKVYKPMPYDRPMWDPSAVLYAVEPDAGYFTVSEVGTVTVTDDAYTRFEAHEGGQHRYLSVTPEQAAAARARIVELVTRRPQPFAEKN
jgi:inosine-uridine nucleoside N-ribohydrolase